MNKLSFWLGSFLALQLLLASGIFLGNRFGQSAYESKPLFAFDKTSMNKMIVKSEDAEVIMSKSNGNWLISDAEGLAVDVSKLDSALKKLQALKSNWPVTTTASSHERLEVSSAKYQRRIGLYQDDTLLNELYLGSSPGLRKAYVRPVDDNKVYALEINAYEFSSIKDDWLDKKLLAVKDATAIKGPDYGLKKINNKWQFDDVNELSEVNADKANQLSNTLTSLRVTGVVDKMPQVTPQETVSIEVSGSDKWHYQLFEKDEKFYIKRDDNKRVFTLGKQEYDRLTSIKMADLKVVETEKTPNSGNQSEASGVIKDG